MAKAKLSLPPLVFGNNNPIVLMHLDQMHHHISSVTNWFSEFDILTKECSFQHRSATLRFDNLSLISISSTPTVMKVYSPECTIAIPMVGTVNTWINNEHFEFGIGKHAMLIPKGKRHSEGLTHSSLLINVNEERLNKTAKAMSGKNQLVDLELQTPRLLSLTVGNLDFASIFKQMGLLIGQFKSNEVLLKNLGIDDSVYRVLVMMLKPELFLKVSLKEKNTSRTDTLDLVCEYIQAHLNEAISLTTLEELSGWSAKTLQLAFMRRFTCAPMQWIREQRLAYANQLLLSATSATKIGHVAALCGYSNFGYFSRYYAKRYGELPSQTLANALKGR